MKLTESAPRAETQISIACTGVNATIFPLLAACDIVVAMKICRLANRNVADKDQALSEE